MNPTAESTKSSPSRSAKVIDFDFNCATDSSMTENTSTSSKSSANETTEKTIRPASKAIGTGWSGGVRWRDVVVSHADRPGARLAGAALAAARRLGSSGATEVRVEHPPGLVIATVRLLA